MDWCHFPGSEKHFSEPEICGKIPGNSAERTILSPNLRLQISKFHSPKKMQFYTPSHSIPPLDSLLNVCQFCRAEPWEFWAEVFVDLLLKFIRSESTSKRARKLHQKLRPKFRQNFDPLPGPPKPRPKPRSAETFRQNRALRSNKLLFLLKLLKQRRETFLERIGLSPSLAVRSHSLTLRHLRAQILNKSNLVFSNVQSGVKISISLISFNVESTFRVPHKNGALVGGSLEIFNLEHPQNYCFRVSQIQPPEVPKWQQPRNDFTTWPSLRGNSGTRNDRQIRVPARGRYPAHGLSMPPFELDPLSGRPPPCTSLGKGGGARGPSSWLSRTVGGLVARAIRNTIRANRFARIIRN